MLTAPDPVGVEEMGELGEEEGKGEQRKGKGEEKEEGVREQ